MKLECLINFLTIFQIVTLSQNSHVQDAKHRIRAEVRSALGQQHHHYPHHPHYHQQQHHHLPPAHFYKHHYHGSHWHDGQRVHRLHHGHRNRWSGRRKSIEHHHFTAWTAWSACGHDCVKRRERYCKAKRKCGHTKHAEEHKCWNCHFAPAWQPITHDEYPHHHHQQQQQQSLHHNSNTPQSIIINAAAAAVGGGVQGSLSPASEIHVHHIEIPVLKETIINHKHRTHPPEVADELNTIDAERDTSEESDFYVMNESYKFRKQRNPILIEPDDYAELRAEEQDDELEEESSEIVPVRVLRTRNQHHQRRGQKHRNGRKHQKHYRQQTNVRPRNLAPGDEGIEGDTFQYDDFDFDQDLSRGGFENEYSDSYEDSDYAEFRNSSLSREKATPNGQIPKHRRIYSKWSRWTKCSPKCTTRRYKKCRVHEQCGREVLREIAYCYTEGSFCQQWLEAQIQQSPPYEVRPVAASRRRDIATDTGGTHSNSIVSDFIMNSKGYRGSEYTPMKLKCGIAPIRSNKRNMYSMMKIIGGKASRKGEWPWQVAIFNRFKEAFCGGTLIAPQWVLTAAHCVRKVLFVRIGEHNLDYEDGTELQLRVLKSFKHPNFDKKTVDSDVALLKLPKPVNTTSWIGFSCLPRPYQPLPKNIECTVIGWGKRRNRDAAGTSILHQASVPIIPMDNCRSVYQDYTITKNMFCAGHKRGRIDTCAGDSGGPLLCRDTTKPNHPWTMFGITSFGDGCAKRNKFGIYAKVPNYVDWVWSVINCNGNCKLHQRSNYGYGNGN